MRERRERREREKRERERGERERATVEDEKRAHSFSHLSTYLPCLLYKTANLTEVEKNLHFLASKLLSVFMWTIERS
jgi:hypothetical protein